MAAGLGRYTVSSPATSFELGARLQDAIDNGTRTVDLELIDADTLEVLTVEFTLTQSRFRKMSTEYIGTLEDNGIASVTVMTHPDLSDTPARLTLARRSTP